MSLISENTLVIDSHEDKRFKVLFSQETDSSILVSNLKQIYNKDNLIIYTFDSNGFPVKLADYIDFFIIENVSSEGRMTMKGNQQESHFKAVTLLKKMIPAKDYREVKESIEYTIGY